MRFTFGTFKVAVRDPGFTIAGSGDPPRFPNTSRSLQRAVREYHSKGPIAARQSLRQSLSGPYWRKPRGAGMAAAARQLLEAYFRLDASDGRPSATFDLKSDVVLGTDVISVNVDICVFDPVGYGARLVLWDTRPCSNAQAAILLAPCVLAVEQEMGTGTTTSAEVWHMRTTTKLAFAAHAALRAINDAQRVLQRAQL